MGFCFGVRRAVEVMNQAAHEGGLVESLGTVVHNPQVVEKMARQGIEVIADLDEVKGGTVAITAHGVGPQVLEGLRTRDFRVVDTTCPIVKAAQNAAKKLSEAGFFVIIFGDPKHPEVRGVLGWAKNKGMATTDVSSVLAMEKPPRRIGILSQTTQPPCHFSKFVNNIISSWLDRSLEIRVVNTTCDATTNQQEAALALAKRVDVMIAIGGKNSANTRHLAEICSDLGTETYHIERAVDIQPSWIKDKEQVGITAGASTPDEAIEEVISYLRSMAEKSPSKLRYAL